MHLAADAVMTAVADWQVVQRYGDVEDELRAVLRSAGVCDISGRSAIRIKSFHLDEVLGERSPKLGAITSDGDDTIARLTAEEALAICPPSAEGSWHAGIEPLGTPSRYLTDVTPGLAGVRIAGPRALEVIASLTDLDLRDQALPDNSCRQAGFAQVHGTLLRLDIENTPAYELYVAREFGVYIWEVILESLGHGAVTPFGAQALKKLVQKVQGR